MNGTPSTGRWFIRGWLMAGFALGLLVFLGLNLASYLSARRSAEAAYWVRHTHEVLAQIQEIRSRAADAQAAMRGYVISGREDFLAQYHKGLQEMPNDQRTLRKLTADNPNQQDRLQRLDALIGEHLEFVQATVELRRTRGMEAAVAQVSSGRGQKIMDQLRLVTDELEKEERSLLGERESQASTTSGTFYILPAGTFIGLGFLLVALFFLNAEISQRQRAEAENRGLAAIVQSTDDAVISKTLEGIITSWNPGAERILGYTAREAIGQKMQKFIPPERSQEEADILVRIGRGERVQSFETVRICRDGRRVQVSVTISPVKDAAGRIIGTSKILRDVSASRRMESEVARLAAIAATSDDAIIGKTLDGIVTTWNEGAETIFGYAAHEMVGQPILRLIPGERQHEEQEILARVRRGESIRHFETVRIRKDGSRIDVAVTTSAVKDVTGKIIGASKIARDISASKRMELALRASEERFRTMANSMSQLAWIARADGFIVWYNQRWYEYTGRTLAQMEGWGWQSVHDPAVLPTVVTQWTRAIASGEQFEMEFPLRRADGLFRTFLTRAHPLKDEAGRVVQWFGTNTDVEVLKQAEEKIRLLNLELEQRVQERTLQLGIANRELEAFSYSVSHDLRAPLRGIDGYVLMLQEDYGSSLDAEANRLIGVVSSEARRMGRLIDDLLAFSRMGRQHMQRTPVDMTALARGLFENLASTMPAATPQFELQQLPPAQGDPAMIRQVLVNLLSNAIKFSRHQEAPVIEVGGSSGDVENTYYVRDNGVGFDAQYSHKLFGVFQRLHSEDEFEGTGVGLALVQRVVHRHGGKVWAESEPGKGAIFHFTLPNQKESNP